MAGPQVKKEQKVAGEKTVKLKFHADAVYNNEVVYSKDSVHDVKVEKGWADRWIRRGVCVEVYEEEKSSDKKEGKGAVDKPVEKSDVKSEVGPQNSKIDL